MTKLSFSDGIMHDIILYTFLYLRKYTIKLCFKKILLAKYSVM